MANFEFDKCPSCGSEGIYGLRCHPKFSVCYQGRDENGEVDMCMAYFHYQHQNDWFAEMMGLNFLYKQRWNGKEWEEYA